VRSLWKRNVKREVEAESGSVGNGVTFSSLFSWLHGGSRGGQAGLRILKVKWADREGGS
jgi:hypothetical protein